MLRRSADDTEDTDASSVPSWPTPTSWSSCRPGRPAAAPALSTGPGRRLRRRDDAARSASRSPTWPRPTTSSRSRPLDVEHVVVTKGGTLDELRDRLPAASSVLVGHSGVGKSTLVNALVPAPTGPSRRSTRSPAAAATPPPRPWAGAARGRLDHRHPGMRSFGLAHVRWNACSRASPTCRRPVHCPKGCTHLAAECALDDWVARATRPSRLESLRRLLASRDGATATDPGVRPGAAGPGDA